MKMLFHNTTILLCALAALLPTPLMAGTAITYTATYDFGRLSIGTVTLGGATYTTVHYDGMFNVGVPGHPSLPVDYIRFSVPYNATSFSVTVNNHKVTPTAVEHMVYPCQEHSGAHSVTVPDSSIYFSESFYPVQSAWVEGESMLAGENHIVTVAVMPVSYRRNVGGAPGTGVLSKSPSVTLTLSYELSDTLSLYPVTRHDNVLRNKGFDNARSMVVNPDDVASNSCPLPSVGTLRDIEPPYPDSDAVDPLTYLIVATPESLHPMRRLAALKRQKGISVKIVTVSEAVTDSLAGQGDALLIDGQPYLMFTDDAGKLKQYLRMNYYYNGTEYVLLAGAGVPYRVREGTQTDLYFSELNGDWYAGTYTDNGGELSVGRLLGTSKQQFDSYTDKLLRYELNPGNGDLSYLKRAMVTEGVNYCTDSGTPRLSDTFTTVTVVNEDEYDTEYTGCDVLDLVRTGHYGLMTSFNDAFPTGIRVFDEYDSYDSHYIWAVDTVKVSPGVDDDETGNGLNLMDNKVYPMVYFSYQGQTMPYSDVPGYGSCINYGESFTMGKDYGGPAYVGLTKNITGNNQGGVFANVFLSNLLGVQSVLGEKLIQTKAMMSSTSHEDIILASNLLGDPALEMWTGQPQRYSGVTVSRTDNSVSVSGIPSGTTKVAYHSNDGTTGIHTCSSSSITMSDVSPNSAIMLYRHDYIPYVAPLVLQNTDLVNSQYVFADKVDAGYAVDSGRTQGDVNVKSGADYEIEASGEVILGGGFNVERGASFSVIPSTYR